jgi:hypothetical protein
MHVTKHPEASHVGVMIPVMVTREQRALSTMKSRTEKEWHKISGPWKKIFRPAF